MSKINKDAESFWIYLRRMSIVVHIAIKGVQKTITYRLWEKITETDETIYSDNDLADQR